MPASPFATRALRAARTLTTPLLPDDYLTYINPLWSLREPRGRIEAVLPETPDSATLWIRTGPDWPDHTPGQYVRVGVDIDGVRHWRTYSLTSVPGRGDGRIAIAVKAIPDGLVSHHLVHRTRPGTIVRLGPPAGEFTLPAPLPPKLLFVTAGSGITPVLGMLRSLDAAGALPDVRHVHIAPSALDAMFAAELDRLGRRHAGYRLHLHLDDHAGGFFDAAGLGTLIPDLAEREAWACGPEGLLDSLTTAFEAAGAPDRLHLERFRPVVPATGAAGEGGTISFTVSGVEVEADGATPLLVAGEEAGALLPNGCRMGICHTCVGRLCSGAVRDLRTGELNDAEGDLVRTCISAAEGRVEIEL